MKYSLQAILDQALKKYINFDSPSYSFIDTHMSHQCAVYKELSEQYNVKEDTDFNCEVCMHYYINDNTDEWEVCTSMVGPYAMVTKKISENNWAIISDDSQNVRSDQQLITILKKNGYQALPETTLKTKIPEFFLESENTEGLPNKGAYLYQLLFFHSYLHLLCDNHKNEN